jgi:hypothetical protein
MSSQYLCSTGIAIAINYSCELNITFNKATSDSLVCDVCDGVVFEGERIM